MASWMFFLLPLFTCATALIYQSGEVACSCNASTTILDCSNQQITNLSNMNFSECRNLTDLRLSGNLLSKVSASDISALTKLTSLFLHSNQLSDISGLSPLTKLTNLTLDDNQLSDISALSTLTRLTYLTLSGNQLYDVSGLSLLTQLTFLELDDNQLSDISGLSPLTQLTFLFLFANQLSDISALSTLTQLTILYLDYNLLSDISALSTLTQLTQLTLSSNQLSDISALSPLTQLTQLTLSGNQLSDISVLSTLTQLTDLALDHNQLSDISGLSPLTQLTSLYLDNNQLSDVSALSPLTRLTGLSLHNNQLSDISGLSPLTQLTMLTLHNNQLSDISGLSTLTQLQQLTLSGNQLSDIFGLSTLTQLTFLSLDNNQLSDVSTLSALTQLTRLYLDHNQLSDISGLSPLTQLTSLSLDVNHLSDISGLSKLTQLTWLTLDNNQLSDVSGLSPLTRLDTLDLSNNQVSDIVGLSSLTRLTSLRLSDNSIVDISPLSPLVELTLLDLRSNRIESVSPKMGYLFHNTTMFFMYGNPTICLRVLNLEKNEPEIICDCSKGYYGTNFCSSIKETYLELPIIVSKRSNKCLYFREVLPEFCPSKQITGTPKQVPSLSNFTFNVTINSTETVSLPQVTSAFQVKDAWYSDYDPLPARTIITSTGLNTDLITQSFEAPPNPNIPNNITYNVSHPLPQGITFTNGTSMTWFEGQPSSMSNESIGQFNITVFATEHLTGETKISAHVFMNITVCGNNTCNGHGRCSAHPDNPYQPVCTCASGYTGMYCDAISRTSFPRWVLPVAISGALLLIFVIAGYYYYFRKSKDLTVAVDETTRLLNCTDDELRDTEQLLFNREEQLQEIENSWNIPWSDLVVGEKIAEGSFGAVYRARWQGNEVAVKMSKKMKTISTMDAIAMKTFEKEFENELQSMTQLRHPNLVTFYGAGLNTANMRFLVVEYLANGSLRNVLDNRSIELSWNQRLKMCRDIALGMGYLHKRDPSVMHRDLKAENCFVSPTWTTKVGDFGSAKDVTKALRRRNGESSTNYLNALGNLVVTASTGCGTPLWTAPEVIATARHGSAHYGLPADVYSYGIVMFEVATREYPYAEKSTVPRRQLLGRILTGLRPLVTVSLPHTFMELMKRCWSDEVAQRPSFCQISDLLQLPS